MSHLTLPAMGMARELPSLACKPRQYSDQLVQRFQQFDVSGCLAPIHRRPPNMQQIRWFTCIPRYKKWIRNPAAAKSVAFWCLFIELTPVDKLASPTFCRSWIRTQLLSSMKSKLRSTRSHCQSWKVRRTVLPQPVDNPWIMNITNKRANLP